MDKLKFFKEKMGYGPHDSDFTPTHSIEACTQVGEKVCIAGRIVLKRHLGKIFFLQILDRSAQIQILLKENDISTYDIWVKTLDLGDVIGIEGHLYLTPKKELACEAVNVFLLAKNILPFPDKISKISSVDTYQRKRYIQTGIDLESKKVFMDRSKIISATRTYLEQRGYIEVETPMLHNRPTGAEAKPFITHHNTLGIDLYLRIAPELYLKRLIVGGFERVFEINRSFRNEGISTKHNPEFTMLECYKAYSDYKDMMSITEDLINCIANSIHSKIKLPKRFLRKQIDTLIEEHLSIDPTCAHSIAQELEKRSLPIKENNLLHNSYLLFEEVVADRIIEPTFVLGYPAFSSPLCKTCNDNRNILERTELYIQGMEVANIFSELTDFKEQNERFLRNNTSDDEYVEALKFGLVPTSGLGIGMDRLTMLLTGVPSIKQVVLFPTSKPL